MSATGTARDHVDPAALGQLFTDAHTTYGFQDTPVSDETLHTIYDVMRLAPTSLNAQPLRINRHSFGRLNGAIQVGYFIIAARAAGLDVGPMAGFDNAAVDAEFFADSAFRSLVVANLGYAAADGQQPRNPRLEPHQVFTIVNS